MAKRLPDDEKPHRTSPRPAPTAATAPLPVTARWEQELPALLAELAIPTAGLVQVGAHTGQEVPALARCGFRRLVMMEPNLDHIDELRDRLHTYRPLGEAGGLPAHEVVVAAAGARPGRTTLYVTEYDQQASALRPLPPLTIVRMDEIPVVPVRQVQQGCNVLVVDAQGSELEVLAGTDLERLDLAVIEGSTEARYASGATLDAIGDYMRTHGWREVAVWKHLRPHVADVAWLAPARVSEGRDSGPTDGRR